MAYYTYLDSPLGQITLLSCGQAITGLYLQNNYDFKDCIYEPSIFKHATMQLKEYFDQKRKTFDLPLAPYGTIFQQRVWQALLNIRHGKTVSYGEIAKAIDSPQAARAVGMANSKNPIAIIIPCHRVIGANGMLTGYSGGGLCNKQWLLTHESKF